MVDRPLTQHEQDLGLHVGKRRRKRRRGEERGGQEKRKWKRKKEDVWVTIDKVVSLPAGSGFGSPFPPSLFSNILSTRDRMLVWGFASVIGEA